MYVYGHRTSLATVDSEEIKVEPLCQSIICSKYRPIPPPCSQSQRQKHTSCGLLSRSYPWDIIVNRKVNEIIYSV